MKYLKFIILIVIISFISCKEAKQEQSNVQNITTVKTYVVKKINHNYKFNTSGRISAEDEQKLSFKTGGLISKIYVSEGQNVKKGTLLASLDLSEIKAKVDQAKLAYDKAMRDLERVKNLYNDSVASLEQMQNTQTAFNYSKSNLVIAEFNLNHSQISAPEKGIILKILAEENEITGQGYPVILFGTNNKSWIVNTNITDYQIMQVHLNDKALVYTDAYPDTFFNATVSEISNFADPYTGVFDVKLELNPVKLKLVSGLITKNIIITQKQTEVLKVPYNALLNANGDHAYVYVVKGHKAKMRKIGIFKILDEYVLVNEGIIAGDTLITENVTKIRENDNIKIKE